MASPLDNKTVLITGGAGFIGSNTLLYLYHRYPHTKFVVLDALTYAGDIRNIPEELQESPRFRFVYGDVRNAKVVDKLVSDSNFVIHFAAETHVARSIYDDVNFFETDVIGTQRVANAVLTHRGNVERFIHISTSEVYGTALKEKIDEEHLLVPQSPYAAAKAGADRLVQAYYITYKIPAVIVRPFNIYGPRQHLEKLIPRFVTSCLLGEPLTVHGTGESSRDFTYVKDLARALEAILLAPKEKVEGEIFNVGQGKHYMIRSIAEMVIDEMNSEHKEKISYSPYALNIGDRPGQVFRHTADAGKIDRTLGWRPQVDFKDGIKKVVAWYAENRDWWRHKLWMRHVPIETEEGKIEYH
ncbi:MAG: GDP-mannose 4,6-dehydratase [Candidatus Liptonbacteria bacterium]|nr:GDP-mannose 4,6-dehydratase [Candidatus Liptonbacteria bacterium]